MILSPGESLIEAILPELEGAGRDYSGNLVVFPGKRPSHFLRKSLSREIGGSFIPPVVLSMDEFIDRVYDSRRDTPNIKVETLDATALLHTLHKKSGNPLGGDYFMTPDSFFPLGMKIYRDIEELLIEGVPSRKVKEMDGVLGESVPQFSAGRLQTLSYFFEEFYPWMASRGMSTRSSRYRAASETLSREDLIPFRKLIFAGFYAFTRSEKVLFRRMLSWDHVHLFFQAGPGIEACLTDLGIETVPSQGETIEPEVRFYRSPDTHGQVFALASLLKRGLEEEISLDENSVIVLPLADTLFPLLYHGLGFLHQEDYNISLGYPLQRTPVYGFLNSLMELISSMDENRVYLPDYLNFILHPYTKNIYCDGRSEITRIMFHTLEEELTGSRTKAFFDLSEVEEDGDFYRKIAEKISGTEPGISEERLRNHLKAVHRNTIGRFLSFRDVEDFARRSIEILHYIFDASTARLHPLFFPFSEAFVRVFQTLSRSLMKDTRFTETGSYFTLFRKYLATCYTPFDGTPVKGLQVLGVLETRGLSFDRVFVLDMNEGILPDTRKEDSLLPYRVREALGLPTYRDRDRLSAYYFEVLWKGAKEVHLFSIENDEKEKSRFVEKLLWERQKKDREKDSGRYFRSVQYRLQLGNTAPEEIPKSPEMIGLLRNLSYSATSLDTYLNCPLRFYYRYVLRIDRREEVTESIERADIGKFVHLVLSQFFDGRKGFPLREKDIDPEEMERLIEALFLREYGKDPVGAAYLLKGRIQGHLKSFLLDYTLPLIREHAVTVLHVEHNIRVRKNSFALRGRLDQVEKRGETIRIVDYKTSSNPDVLRIQSGRLDLARRETWGEAIGSLQLPFYLLLYSSASGKSVEELDALFLFLGRVRIGREIEAPLLEAEENPKETFDRLESVIFRLLGEIVDPGVAFGPARDRKGLCPGCDFRYLCGTQWIG